MPEVEPHVESCETVILEAVETILHQIIKCQFIESDLKVCVIAMVQDHCLDRAYERLGEPLLINDSRLLL